MNEQEVLQTLNRLGAIISDSHIVYTSGKHGSNYINKDAIYPYTEETSRFCHALAMKFAKEKIEVVVGPTLGGIVLSQWTSYHLSKINKYNVFSVYAEKTEDGNSFIIRRGYDKLVRGKRVLVVEDVLNTGGSAKKVVEAVRGAGGNVIGLGAICNRGGVRVQDVGDVPLLVTLVNLNFETWDESDCPFCRKNIPINTDVGKGYKFLYR